MIEIPKGSKIKYDIADLPPHRVKELQRFFLDYKVLEDKVVNVEHLRGQADALEVIREAVRLYTERIVPTRRGRG